MCDVWMTCDKCNNVYEHLISMSVVRREKREKANKTEKKKGMKARRKKDRKKEKRKKERKRERERERSKQPQEMKIIKRESKCLDDDCLKI